MHTTHGTLDIPDIEDIHLAHARIRKYVRQTPSFEDEDLSTALGCRLVCKCENLQRTGSFKLRGASNAVARLREQGIEGPVATHSSGNHGAALALAARLDGREAHVVMPENASAVKVEAVRQHGATVHFCAPGHQDREAGLARLVARGHIPIPPFDHADIIAGQGTAALELWQFRPELDVLVAPVGGGGLIAGSSIATASRGVTVYAAEPAGAADTAASLEQGERVTQWPIDTIADGLRALVGKRNFAVIQAGVKQVLTVDDDEIRQAMMLFWHHTRMLIEPSSAVVIAAIMKHRDLFAAHAVGAIITGGNITPQEWTRLTMQSPSP